MIDGSYALSDFLLFSQETYFRLFELYNRDVFPLQILFAGLAAVLLVWMRRGRRARTALGLLAAVWVFAGWAFHLQRYATINIAAPYFAGLFFVEAAVLVLAALRGRPTFDTSHAGLALVLLGLLIDPLIGVAAGRGWAELSFFGLGPDPTAIVTAGVLVACRPRWLALAAPLLWCVIGLLTALSMDSVEVLGPAAALVIVFGVGVRDLMRGRVPAKP